MIILLEQRVKEEQIRAIQDQIALSQLQSHQTHHGPQQVIVVPQASKGLDLGAIEAMPGVASLKLTEGPYHLASKSWKPSGTSFDVKGITIGGTDINVIGGPCAVETEEQVFATAALLHKLGVKFIRGGAYKPRTSPYSFQGLGLEGLKLLRKAADQYDLRVVTEVLDYSLLDEVYEYADILQIGSRNMHNFYFLKQLGKTDKPILLKRGMNAKITEWLLAAEYILLGGNEKVILCERGIRTFNDTVRNTMDVAAITIAKELSHLPVFADPSHGTGARDRVATLSQASIAAGADGLLLEVHPSPQKALSDGEQSLFPDQFATLIDKVRPVAKALARSLDVERKNINLESPIFN